MAGNVLEIILKADANNAIKGIIATEAALDKMPNSVNKASKSLNDISKSSGSATLALSNLGRVAQDAPFGFIGISNNLNPLLESFQRLKAESGSTGGALKALAGGLVGAGGIGLALSAITAAITFAQIGFRAWGGSAKESSSKVKEAAEAAKIFSDSIANEIVQVNILGKTISDANIPMSERVLALNELRKQYPEYLKGLSDEEALTKGVSIAVRALTIELIRRAVVNAQQAKISKIVADNLENVTEKINESTERAKAGRKDFDALFNKKPVLDFDSALGKAKSTLGAIGKDGLTPLNESQIKSISIFTEIQKILGPLIDDLTGIGGVFGKIGGETESGAKSFSDFVQNLRSGLDSLGAKRTGSAFEQIESETRKLTSEFLKLKKEGKLTAQDIIDGPGIIAQIDALKKEIANRKKLFDFKPESLAQNNDTLFFAAALKFSVEKTKKDIDFLVKAVNTPIQIPISLGNLKIDTDIKAAIDKAAAKVSNADFENLKKSIQDTLTNTLASGLEAVGAAIGGLLAGTTSGLSAFISVIVAGLQSIGKALIAFGIAKITLDKFTKIPGPVAIAAGVGLIALASLLKAQIGQTKFAEGGIVSGPLNAAIGEAGQSEVILPLSRLGSLLQGGARQIIETRVSGQDLLLILNRANASRGRTFG